MSGGAFDYKQHRINDIIEEITFRIKNNPTKKNSEWNEPFVIPNTIIDKMKETVKYLTIAQNTAHCLDYYLSGDYGEETFLKEWDEITKEYNNEKS